MTAHSVIELNITEGAIGNSIPLLVLQDGSISFVVMLWAKHLMLHDIASAESLRTKVCGIGRFYDFFVLVKGGKKVHRNAMLVVLEEFYQARRYGLPVLNWEPVTPQTAKVDEEAVTRFNEWCAENLGVPRLNPTELKLVTSLNFRSQQTFRRAQQHRRNWDKLSHLAPATPAGKGFADVQEFDPQDRHVGSSDYPKKYFPPERVRAFIKTLNLRDALYFLLLFFGGLRASEPLHIFARDITILPDGIARVVVGHPELDSYRWFDAHGRERLTNRAQFLSERYGIGPRNRLAAKHPLHSGWKGMRFDVSRFQTEVYWLRPDAGRLFAKLHIEYMKTIRSRVADNHPFYLVNTSLDSDFGNPVTLSNMNKSFYRAAARVGLSPSEDGVNPHGGRHYYGYFHANVYKTQLEHLQMYMHHVSIESTKVYYNVTKETARAELQKAWETISRDFPEMLCLDPLFHPVLA
ncbi:site-specific integrase [Paraburkholderia panacisoli]|uniref:site-specific integrase n=1 Tax=Paraburkholderia panacisoli TaxID=2603818 RepID=UPI00165F9097|nr:site-specific integrase [Paraburkholderia panacisoli]